MQNMYSLSKFVDSLQQRGRYSFSKREAQSALAISPVALKFSLNRLIAKKRIASVKRGFYVIIPVEYMSTGIIPADWFIDDLMKFLGVEYYVGLLSAAALHGAAEQQPQEFQVVVPVSLRTVQPKDLRIRFAEKKYFNAGSVRQIKTMTGFMKVSDPAQTALDLVGYANLCGGMDAIAPIIEDLSESITPDSLVSAARSEKIVAVVQRLGTLLDALRKRELASALLNELEKKRPAWTPLDPSLPRKGMPWNDKWRVIENRG